MNEGQTMSDELDAMALANATAMCLRHKDHDKGPCENCRYFGRSGLEAAGVPALLERAETAERQRAELQQQVAILGVRSRALTEVCERFEMVEAERDAALSQLADARKALSELLSVIEAVNGTSRGTRALKKAREALAALPSEETPQAKFTVHFVGGPWDGQTYEADRVVGPLFAVGHEVGNHYWLDSNSTPPTYHWDGTPWETTP